MEKKERPIVPAKPRTLSVADKARNFEKVMAELTDSVGCKSIKVSKSESDINNADIRNTIELSTNGTFENVDSYELFDISADHLINSENEASADDYSSVESIFFGAEEWGEHIYDEICEPSGVTNIVDEILAVEENYISRLNYTIDNYVETSRPVMGDPFMKAVFGNIEEIKAFHEDSFYPDLRQCNRDLIRILECFSSHIAAGNFYIYVVYAMNKKRSDEERNNRAFKTFIEERQSQIGDKLGLHSLLTEPFQRFFKYQNLIESLLKKIKDNKPNFMEIAATSKALHDVKKLLNTANKSMALTEIVDSKINLMNQGNFLTQNEFNIFDHNQKRKYKGNIFVFEHCVVCTERLSSEKLQFKAYFPNGTSHTECINENKFLLYERNNYKVEVSSDANKIQQMLKQVRQVLSGNEENRMSTISNISYNKIIESKAPIQQLTKELELSLGSCKRSASNDSLNLLSDKEANTTNGENRRSNSSAESGVSGSQSDEYNEKQQFRQMIKNFDKFYEKVAAKIPTPPSLHREETKTITDTSNQTSSEIIHEMLATESEYIRQLSVGIETYIPNDHTDIIETLREKIRKIFGNIRQIRDFHENTFYGQLSDCKDDITKLANVFIKFTQEGLFSNYLLYAMNHSNTQPLCSMRPYREFFELRQKEVDDIAGVECYLFLPFQHLSKYQFFMDRIITTLNIDNDTAVMAACSKAVKNIERLVKDMQSTWTVSNVPVRRRPIRKLSSLVLNGIQNMRRH
ncbi:proto-oncogene DBL-like isoform X2 [Bradysia coprophila]|uniref:proto-oncogene DBL-like isoform X2 n=1 Tax=Bradysia coprophila TaxID=38358 RepID=UPI00187D941C|nr:proto-oncogene DBL-like isoform X2 [Bradysia coprophila]